MESPPGKIPRIVQHGDSQDILTELRIDLHFSTNACTWDSHTIPMRDIRSTVELGYLVEEMGSTADSTTRLKKILDSK